MTSQLLLDIKNSLENFNDYYINYNASKIFLSNIVLPKYDNLQIYTKAKDLINDAIELIPFANENVKNMKKVLDYSFITEEVIINNACFDLRRIVGSDHPSYIGKTWGNMIDNLQREINIKALFLDELRDYGSISYYKNRDNFKGNEDPWGFTVINDNETYICEGNHRTVIAKFLNALDLIDSNINALKYVRYLKVDHKEARKFNAVKKWLKKHYYMYHIDLEARKVLVNKY